MKRTLWKLALGLDPGDPCHSSRGLRRRPRRWSRGGYGAAAVADRRRRWRHTAVAVAMVAAIAAAVATAEAVAVAAIAAAADTAAAVDRWATLPRSASHVLP